MTDVEMREIEMALKDASDYMAMASSFLDAVGECITAAKAYDEAYASFCKTVEER